MAGHTKYLGSKGNVLPNPTQTEFHNHSKEETTMTTTNNAAVNTAETVDLVTAAQNPAVEEAPVAAAPTAPAEKVKAPEAEARLKAIKGGNGGGNRFAWESVIAAGVVGSVGALTGMIVSNKLNTEFRPEDGRQYSALEMAGVSIASGLVAGGLQAAVQQIDAVNDSEENRFVAMSAIANGTAVSSMFIRDKVLDMFSSRNVSVADFVTDEEMSAE